MQALLGLSVLRKFRFLILTDIARKDISRSPSCIIEGSCSVEQNINSEQYLNSFTVKSAEVPKSLNFVESANTRLKFLRRRTAFLARRSKRIGIVNGKCCEELQSTKTETCLLKRKRQHARWFEYHIAQLTKLAAGDRQIAFNVTSAIILAAEKFIKSDNPEDFQSDIEKMRGKIFGNELKNFDM